MYDISSPKNPKAPTYIVHCRVSTAKQAYEGESLDVQADICMRIAAERGWKLVHPPWKESFSGRKSQRPAFNDILRFLDDHPGKVRYCVFRSIDRFTRGGSLPYEQMKRELNKRGVELVDSNGIIQPVRNTLEDVGFEYDWSRSSPSEIAEIVVATSAKNEVTTILTRLIGQEIRLTQRGYKIRQAADGFINTKIFVEGRKRTIQVPDPERAKYLVEIFELRAAGQLSDKEICKRVNAMGYRTREQNRWDSAHRKAVGRTGGKPLLPKQLQQIIQRPIYCGIVCEKWTRWQPIRAAYDGLVSLEVFNAANRGKIVIRETEGGTFEVLYNQRLARKAAKPTPHNPLFPYRHVVVCPRCRMPLTGSSPRGRNGTRYPSYHCSRKHSYFGVPKATLEAAVDKYVKGLRFRPEAVESFRTMLLRRREDEQSRILDAASSVNHTVAELEAHKAEATRAFKLAVTDVMRRSLEADAEQYEQQIEAARSVRDRLQVTEHDIELFLRDVKTIVERPGLLLEPSDNPQELKASYATVFQEPPAYNEIAAGTAKLAAFFYLSSDAETSESALVHLSRLPWKQIESIILEWKENAALLRIALSRTSPKS